MPPPSPSRAPARPNDALCPVALAVLGQAAPHRTAPVVMPPAGPHVGTPTRSGGVDQIAGAFASVLGAADDLTAIRADLANTARALQAQAVAGAILQALEDGLHPDHGYDPKSGAAFLGVQQSSYLKISAVLLPRFGAGRVLGIDLMAYRGDVTREEADAYKAAKRALVLRMIARAA